MPPARPPRPAAGRAQRGLAAPTPPGTTISGSRRGDAVVAPASRSTAAPERCPQSTRQWRRRVDRADDGLGPWQPPDGLRPAPRGRDRLATSRAAPAPTGRPTVRWRHSRRPVPHPRDLTRRMRVVAVRHRLRHAIAPANERSASPPRRSSRPTARSSPRSGSEPSASRATATRPSSPRSISARRGSCATSACAERWLDGVTRRDPLIPAGRARARRPDGHGLLDRPLRPVAARGSTRQTQGLLPMRNYHTTSTRRRLALERAPPDRPAAPLGVDDRSAPAPRRRRARPAVRALEGLRRPGRRPARARCSASRTTTARPGPTTSVVAADPRNETYFWDQRLAVAPGDRRARGDVLDVRPRRRTATWRSTSRGARPTADAGRRRSRRRSTASTASRSRSGGDRASSRRTRTGGSRPGVRVALSRRFRAGRGTPTARSRSTAAAPADEPPRDGRAEQADYWNAMGAWQFGHPRGVALPERRGHRRLLRAATGTTRSARWARVEVDARSDGFADAHNGPDAHHEDRVADHRLRRRRGLAAGGPARGPSTRPGTSTRFDAFHTDEGVDRLHDAERERARRRRDGRRPARRVRAAADRRGPDSRASALWHKLRRLNRHAYNLSDGDRRRDRRRALGHPRQGRRTSRSPSMLGLAREKIPAYATARNIDPTPETRLQGGAASARRRATTASRSSSGTASTGHPALPGRPRGGRRRTSR